MKVNLCSEPEGWILAKCARVIKEAAPAEVRWNEAWWPDADVNVGINYGYIDQIPVRARKKVAFFCHYNPDVIGDVFIRVAREVDFCTAMSEATSEVLQAVAQIPSQKIQVIELGIDPAHRVKLVLGVVGRTYEASTGGKDTRKGRGLLHRFAEDPWVAHNVTLKIKGTGWGLPAEPLLFDPESLADFYNGLDFLLCSSSIEGGPVPMLEALACGIPTIMPPIGYGRTYPVIHYDVGSLSSLLDIVRRLHAEKVAKRSPTLWHSIKRFSWGNFAIQHLRIFQQIAST